MLCPCHLRCLGTAQEGSPILTVAYISGHARIPTHRAGKPGKRLVPLELTGGGDQEVLIECPVCVVRPSVAPAPTSATRLGPGETVCGGGGGSVLRGLGGAVQRTHSVRRFHSANLYQPELCAGFHARPTMGFPTSTRKHQASVSLRCVPRVSSCLPFCSGVRLA